MEVSDSRPYLLSGEGKGDALSAKSCAFSLHVPKSA